MPRFTSIWRNKLLRDADSIDGLIEVLEDAANELREMKAAGVEFEALGDDYYMLSTEDPDVANRFDMEEEDDEESDFYMEPEYGGEAGEGS